MHATVIRRVGRHAQVCADSMLTLWWVVVACPQARDVERRKEQEVGAAILQQQLVERQAQRIKEEELRDQVSTTVLTFDG